MGRQEGEGQATRGRATRAKAQWAMGVCVCGGVPAGWREEGREGAHRQRRIAAKGGRRAQKPYDLRCLRERG